MNRPRSVKTAAASFVIILATYFGGVGTQRYLPGVLPRNERMSVEAETNIIELRAQNKARDNESQMLKERLNQTEQAIKAIAEGLNQLNGSLKELTGQIKGFMDSFNLRIRRLEEQMDDDIKASRRNATINDTSQTTNRFS